MFSSDAVKSIAFYVDQEYTTEVENGTAMFMDGEVIYAMLTSNHDSDMIDWLCNNDTNTPVTSTGLSATHFYM